MRYEQEFRKGRFKTYQRRAVSNKSQRVTYKHMKRFTAPKCHTVRWWCRCCRPPALFDCNMSKIQRVHDKRAVSKIVEEILYETNVQ